MAVGFSNTNKPLNPRGQDASPKGFNRASLYSGKALDFDGVNDKVNITTDDIDLQEFSVVQYVNLGATAASKIFYSNYAPTGNLGFATGISDSTANVPKFYTKGTSSDTLFGSFALNAGEWYQIVTTYDGATKKIYVNGVLDTSVAFSSGILYTNATNQIGALSGGTAQALDGQLSNAKIFNTALTAAQVADLYNNPEKVVPTGVAESNLKLWLPMMEGAGTTAYDGSGNGNHGTISGATYVNGIGAPVAQTAVISWNKGTNEVLYSEDFSQSDWATSNMTKTTGQTDYIGGTNAVRVNCSSGVNAWFSQPTSGVAVGDVTIGAYIKGVSAGGTLSFSTAGSDRSNSRINYTTEWVYYEWTITETSSSPRVQIDNYSDGGGQEAIDVYFCFPRLVEGTNADVYVRTGATAQTSDVLLPQGLTTGRDITGVNLFENVRKQGALNLDGNSRALVHDNASLDYTSAATLESWVYWTGEGDQGILGRWFAPDSQKSLMLYASDSDSVRVYYSNDGVASFNKEASQTLSVGNWYHFVTTYDGSTIKIYVNAVEGNSAAYSSDIYVSSKHVDIGTYQEDLNKAYNGQIAQPRIYNRALTAEEVLQNYNSGKNTYK